MALLLEHVRLGLPLPHEQLAQGGAPKREPLARGRDRARVHARLGDGQGVYLDQSAAARMLIERAAAQLAAARATPARGAARGAGGRVCVGVGYERGGIGAPATRQLVQGKDARLEADDENLGGCMQHGRRDARVVLVEVVAVGELPPSPDPRLAASGAALGHRRLAEGHHILRLRIGTRHHLPNRERSVARDRVEGVAVGAEEARAHRRAVPRTRGRRVPGQLVHGVHAHAHVLAAGGEEERVGRPREAEDVVARAAERLVQRKGREAALKRRRCPHLHEPTDGEGDPLAIG